MSPIYLDVLKASYDYEPQSEDEIAMKEDQLVFLLEKTDQDWWKVKMKSDNDEDKEGGLVPAAYLEPAEHMSIAKALYDYDASAPGELTVKEDDVLLVYDRDDDWLLVKNDHDTGRVGFVPGNYVEEQASTERDQEVTAPAAIPIIVPPSPPRPARPISTYVDPAELVAANKARSDSIQTWAVSEVDKKGKKKKGTLGVGNGALFFASESDKTPVQKWQTSDVDTSRIEKSKHVYIEINGITPISLHFNAGSKDTAEAIVSKLESSSSLAKPITTNLAVSKEDEQQEDIEEPDIVVPKKNGASVRFAPSPLVVSSPSAQPKKEETDAGHTRPDTDTVSAVALYDFTADGEDELTVVEGEKLHVLERENEEWWKCRNAKGEEGVVPASYIELPEMESSVINPLGVENDEDVERATQETEEAKEAEKKRQEHIVIERREAELEREKVRAERLERERLDRERLERERLLENQRQQNVAAIEAEAKRKKRDSEEKAQAERRAQKERARAEDSAKKTSGTREKLTSATGGKTNRAAEERPISSTPKDRGGKSKGPADGKTRTSLPKNTRFWHDRTGKFEVEAELLSFTDGTLRLHKINGVVIEVPAEKMSAEDMQFIENLNTSHGTTPSDDDEPLALRRKPLFTAAAASKAASPSPAAGTRPQPTKKAPAIDWFEFFLAAGCDVDDCTRYAAAFERDKIDEVILPDITDQTMRLLGLREGDIIRVKKSISQQGGKTIQHDDAVIQEQLRKDEELARQLEAEENGGSPAPKRQTTGSPAPNLFAGPGGALKTSVQRRGRPQPSKSTPPINVELDAITSASEQITQRGSPALQQAVSSTASTSTPSQAPAVISSTIQKASGFDDDAWTPRPASVKPPALTQAATKTTPLPPRPPSSPLPPVSPATVPAPTRSPPASIPKTTTLAKTTEEDVFEQLARLSQLKTHSPAIASPPIVQSVSSPPPRGYQQGLGVGSSPLPIGEHLQSISTQAGIHIHPHPNVQAYPSQNISQQVPNVQSFRPQLQPAQNQHGFSSGPLAPIPANQTLLQPLIPTSAHFNSFVPTRPSSVPSTFSQTSSTSTLSQQSPYISNQSSGLSQPRLPSFFPPTSVIGYSSANGPNGPPPTSFSPPPGQAIGFAGHQAGTPNGNYSSQPLPSFNPGFNQGLFTNGNPSHVHQSNNSPANIFAQMKSGTFGNSSAPQPTEKYDALRQQPSGWGFPGANSFQSGYTGL